jgi:hypothetical protein
MWCGAKMKINCKKSYALKQKRNSCPQSKRTQQNDSVVFAVPMLDSIRQTDLLKIAAFPLLADPRNAGNLHVFAFRLQNMAAAANSIPQTSSHAKRIVL